MAEQEKGKPGRPSAISKLAAEADKRGYMLVEKTPVGFEKLGKNIPVNAEGVGKHIGASLPYLFTNLDLNDFPAVCDTCTQYFIDISERDIIPSITGLCVRLGITRVEFSYWRAGKKRDHRYKELADRCSTLIESATVELAAQNKMNVIASIVQLKNNFGYTDEQKVVVEQKESVVDDTMQMADVLALAGAEEPKKAKYSEVDKQNKK